MGVLSDPSAISQKKKYAKILIKYNRILCGGLYIAAIIWFCCLVDNNLNTKTYFSENALLPGLVYSEVKSEISTVARSLKNELDSEREAHPDTVPYPWLLAKMRRIGLETHTHNFTLNYPLGGGKKYTGKNVYGILRAPRIGSTECLVLTTPYRPPSSIHPEISAGVAVMLAFADFARRQKYWAKDIIFLITDKEQLGIQAWLEAYHNYDDNSVLDFGSLNARAGSIQAAINLEVQDFSVDYINIKLEGLNGQLPNLDLHNLVQKLSYKHGIPTGYKLSSSSNIASNTFDQKLLNLLSMIISQSSGVPTGNHGLFHKYGIEAVTLECFKKLNTNNQYAAKDLTALLQIVEGIFRSLNNLLERFHQSFFFYIMVTGDRFISIGDYMPSIALMAGSLLVKSFIIWLSINEERDDLLQESEDDDKNDDDTKKERKRKLQLKNFNYVKIGVMLVIAHVIGVWASYLPFTNFLDQLIFSNDISTRMGLFYIFLSITIISLIIPFFTKLNEFENELLQIAVLIEAGTALIVIGMLNFSLGFVLCIVLVPFGVLINPRKSKSVFLQLLSKLLCLLLHPLILSYLIVLVITFASFSELTLPAIAARALSATVDGFTYFVVDSFIYGNWMFEIVTIIFVPVWILFWISLFPKCSNMKLETKLKVK